MRFHIYFNVALHLEGTLLYYDESKFSYDLLTKRLHFSVFKEDLQTSTAMNREKKQVFSQGFRLFFDRLLKISLPEDTPLLY